MTGLDRASTFGRTIAARSGMGRAEGGTWRLFRNVCSGPHVHIMLTLRPLTEAGFGRKTSVHVDANGVRQVRTWAGGRGSLRAGRAAWGGAPHCPFGRGGG